jgi:plasmid stability protein
MKGPVKRDARLSVRVPQDVLTRLRVVAVADGRSLADWSYRAVLEALVRAETKLARQTKAKHER